MEKRKERWDREDVVRESGHVRRERTTRIERMLQLASILGLKITFRPDNQLAHEVLAETRKELDKLSYFEEVAINRKEVKDE